MSHTDISFLPHYKKKIQILFIDLRIFMIIIDIPYLYKSIYYVYQKIF